MENLSLFYINCWFVINFHLIPDYDEENYESEGENEEEETEDNLNRENNEIDAPLVKTEAPEIKRKNLTLPCGSDRGGCDHDCIMVQLEWDPEPRIECSCYNGFTLDEHDGRRCHGNFRALS